MTDYPLLVIFLAIAIVFPLIPLALAWAWAFFFSPAKPGKDKGAIYECGIESTGAAHIQFEGLVWAWAKGILQWK